MKLHDIDSIKDYVEMKPCCFGTSQILDFAERCVVKWKYNPQSSLNDMEGFIKKIGGTIHYLDMPELISYNKTIIVHSNLSFDIFLPGHLGDRRLKYFLARELGHLALHRIDKVGCYNSRTTRENKIEIEADIFASGFLLPTKELLEQKGIYEKISPMASSPLNISLAAYFDVLTEAVDERLKTISSLYKS